MCVGISFLVRLVWVGNAGGRSFGNERPKRLGRLCSFGNPKVGLSLSNAEDLKTFQVDKKLSNGSTLCDLESKKTPKPSSFCYSAQT